MVVTCYVLRAISQFGYWGRHLPTFHLVQAFLGRPSRSPWPIRRLEHRVSQERGRKQRGQDEGARMKVLHPATRLTSTRPLSASPKSTRLETLWKKPTAAS